ncbi:carbohydrate esterase family 5 protein [Xylariaceae sp. FL0016]|nr:carbohydrate esterase family 5 protein [Xylariaceae sp. FL0016]
MKFSSSLLSVVLVATATAGPVRRATGTTANEYLNGGCKDLIFICARGTNQSGNMGEMPCPQVADGLKAALGTKKVAAQGVDYKAALASNLLDGGCKPSEAADMADLITDAATSCPNSAIAVAGYSQGAAMVHASVSQLDSSVMNRVYAAVTFGDTQNEQDNERIPNFPTSKTLIICNEGDLVCDGTLTITSAHLDYTSSVPDAVDFIVGKL